MAAESSPASAGTRHSLRARLTLFALLLALPFLALLSIGIYFNFGRDYTQAMEQLQIRREAAGRQLETYLHEVRYKMGELEKAGRATGWESAEFRHLCEQFLRLHPEFIDVTLLDRRGALRHSTSFPSARSYLDCFALDGPDVELATTTFHVTPAARMPGTERWNCVALLPVANDPNLLLALPVDLRRLSHALYLAPDQPDLIVSVADRHLRLVLSSNEPDLTLGELRPAGAQLRQALAQGINHGEFIGLSGTHRVYDAALVPAADWLVSAAVPRDEIYRRAWRNLHRAVLAVLAVLAVGAVLVHAQSSSLVRPVASLAETALAHVDGHHDQLAPVDGPTEIADTARAFNEMVHARRRAEADLIASEHRYRTTVDETGLMIYVHDLASDRLTWFGVHAIPAITGHSLADFRSHQASDWIELVHPDDRSRVRSAVPASKTDRRAITIEYRLRHRRGDYRIVQDVGLYLPGDAQTPARILGRISDVTAAREAERIIAENEQRFRTVIEQTGQMVYQVDFTTDSIQWFGESAARAVTGSSLEELQLLGAERWLLLVHPEDAPRVREHFQRFRSATGPHRTEYRVRHRDGSYRLLEDVGVPLRDDHGRAHRALGRLNDITEHAQRLREISTQQRLLREIIDLVPHFIFAKDRDGRFLLANESLARALGRPPEQLLGRTELELQPQSHEMSSARSADLAVIDARRSHFVPEEVHTDVQGVRRIVSTARIPFNFPTAAGEIPAVLGVSVDITALKRAQDERQKIEKRLLETQKLESLGVLAGGIAHDFNNLLTGILGNTGLVRLEAPSGWPGAEHLAQIEKAAFRAADLCKQMLAYSGRGRFVVQRLSLSALIEETAPLLQPSISKKASLHLSLEPGLPAISADPTQLRQVVVNLVVNASEALEDRAGNITLRTGLCEFGGGNGGEADYQGELPAGPCVFLEISDDGIGMTRETLARIYDPFFTTKFTGRGLGLAAVLGIVRGHDGAIKVQSELGRGTTFRVLFPAVPGSAHPFHRPAAASAGWRGAGHVLIIDDEDGVRSVARGVLELTGFTVEEASNGADGVAAFQRDPARFTAVLLDLTMPHMDGAETFQQLRLLDPDVRVLLMSGYNRVDAVNRFIGKGLAGFVQKPFAVDVLVAELRRVLSESTPGA